MVSAPGQTPLTSLLRQAFRCRGLLDMKNCQVLSEQGLGPGFSGAYCTFRTSRRAEFLGSSRGQHDDTSAWQRQEFCIPMCSHPRSHWQGEAKLSNQPGCIFGPLIPFKAKLKSNISYYLLWILSSTFSVEKAFTSKSTPQVCQRERGQLWNQDQTTGTSADVLVSLCTPEIGRLLPAANYSSLLPLSQTPLTTGVGTSTSSTVLLRNEALKD